MASLVDADTLTTGEARSSVPYPRSWVNGDAINALALNYEVRDSLSWLLGDTRPMFSGYLASPTTAALVTGSKIIPLDTEDIKRGGMVHAAGSSRVTVPAEGWYIGSMNISSTIPSGAAGDWWFSAVLLVNGTDKVAMSDSGQHKTTDFGQHGGAPFCVYLKAGDYVELSVDAFLNGGTATTQPFTDNAGAPRLTLMWNSLGG